MSGASARKQQPDSDLCMPCSACDALHPVRRPAPGTTLLELRCPRCGTLDVYHVNTLRHGALAGLVRR